MLLDDRKISRIGDERCGKNETLTYVESEKQIINTKNYFMDRWFSSVFHTILGVFGLVKWAVISQGHKK